MTVTLQGRLLAAALPGGVRARLAVLLLHRVQAQPDPMQPQEMHARRFEALCGWLARHARVWPLGRALDALRQGTLPPRVLCLTFDDGYADNHALALPILRRHGLTATFFITTAGLDGAVGPVDVAAHVGARYELA